MKVYVVKYNNLEEVNSALFVIQEAMEKIGGDL